MPQERGRAVTTPPPKRLRYLNIDVALSPCPCSTEGCGRVVLPGDAIYFRPIAGLPNACEPLCPVCGASAVEDLRLLARMQIHATEQAKADVRETKATLGSAPAGLPSLPTLDADD